MVAAFAREPSCPVCSRYDYEERILERVLRNEMAIDNLLAEIRQTNAEVKAALNMIKEDKTEIASAIQGGLLTISKAVSAMTTNTSVAITQMERENKILKDQLVIPQVHFFARIAEGQLIISPGQNIIFTNAQINEGQGYDVASGKFTVSVPGLYAFAVQYCVRPNQNGYIDIVNQGTILQRSLFEKNSAGPKCVSMQAFTRAAISDQIWVKSGTVSSSDLHGNIYMFKSFSGVLIHV
ncbi:hypothetical protein DPMN_190403 [Dreissena polymorpha]|uniref:C1q domain-containing protein n=2 Tax=Dreissena polymorpha TaxID=45954 RepID=A0A9D4DWS0_DREPO|nr:hypothetical protein DPMN_190403 [Dreissena polymorpha]